MTDKRIILSTAGSRDEASTIAKALVENKLAACVNIVGPATSVYRWKGAVETAEEFLLIIKTTAAHFPAVAAAIKEANSYELPECLELPVSAGSDAYLAWMGEALR